jgi:hypothetical protein
MSERITRNKIFNPPENNMDDFSWELISENESIICYHKPNRKITIVLYESINVFLIKKITDSDPDKNETFYLNILCESFPTIKFEFEY